GPRGSPHGPPGPRTPFPGFWSRRCPGRGRVSSMESPTSSGCPPWAARPLPIPAPSRARWRGCLTPPSITSTGQNSTGALRQVGHKASEKTPEDVEQEEAGSIHLIRPSEQDDCPLLPLVRRPFPMLLTTPNRMQSCDLGSPPVYMVIPSDAAEARRVQDQVEQCLQATTCHDHDLFSIRLALEEALVNAIKHGNQCDPTKQVQ